MMDAIQIILVMIGILAVISIVNPLLLIPLGVAIICFCLVLKLYLRPAQDLKRLEGICKCIPKVFFSRFFVKFQ